ncbi:hypothetical protein Tco_0378629, partial [Tanacetum coccineum]
MCTISASTYFGYVRFRLVLPHSSSDIVWLFLFAPVCLNMLSQSAALSESAIFSMICSRSSPYLCDFVLCTCLLFIYLCSDLSAVESVFVCCFSSTSVRTSLLLNLYLSAALRLPLFGSLCNMMDIVLIE